MKQKTASSRESRVRPHAPTESQVPRVVRSRPRVLRVIYTPVPSGTVAQLKRGVEHSAGAHRAGPPARALLRLQRPNQGAPRVHRTQTSARAAYDGRWTSPSRPPAGACSRGAAEEVTSRGPVFAANEGVWPCGDPRAPRPCTSGRSCASMCPANTTCSFWRLKQPALSSHCRALLASWWRQWPVLMLGSGHCRLSARLSLLTIEMTVHRSGHSGGGA